MQRKLSKQWGPYAAGTVVVDNLTDAGASPGSIQVNAERFAVLDETGYFEPAEPVRPIPEEVRTAEGTGPLSGRPLDEDGMIELSHRPIAPVVMDEAGRNDQPETPPAFADAGTSGVAARRAKASAFSGGERVRPEMVKVDADGAPQPEPPPEPASAPPDQGEPAKKEP